MGPQNGCTLEVCIKVFMKVKKANSARSVGSISGALALARKLSDQQNQILPFRVCC